MSQHHLPLVWWWFSPSQLKLGLGIVEEAPCIISSNDVMQGSVVFIHRWEWDTDKSPIFLVTVLLWGDEELCTVHSLKLPNACSIYHARLCVMLPLLWQYHGQCGCNVSIQYVELHKLFLYMLFLDHCSACHPPAAPVLSGANDRIETQWYGQGYSHHSLNVVNAMFLKVIFPSSDRVWC